MKTENMNEVSIKKSIPDCIGLDFESIITKNLPWSDLTNKTVLISGAGGFVAYYIIGALLLLNDMHNINVKIIGLVRNEKKARARLGVLADRQEFSFLVQDVCEPISEDVSADYIIHAASQASALQFEMDPVGTINANIAGTSNLLDFAKRCDASRFLFISSLKVYGQVENEYGYLRENQSGYLDYLSYKNCYAVGKRSAEALCACYAKQYGLSVRISRPSYIYGAAALDDDRVWAQFFANVIKNQNILLKSSGNSYRSFCYVADAVSAIFMIMLKGEDLKPYNISSLDSNCTIRKFAETAINAFPDLNLRLKFQNPQDALLIDDLKDEFTPDVMDASELDSLGWHASFDLESGIIRSLDTMRCVQEEKNHARG